MGRFTRQRRKPKPKPKRRKAPKKSSKRRSAKSSSFKPKIKTSIKKATMPKKSSVSPFLTKFKSTSTVSKFAKSTGKRPTSSFTTSRTVSKATPETSSFIASTSSPTFKTRKVGKSKVFSSARLSAKPTTTSGGSLVQILENLKTTIPKNGTSLPPLPDSPAGRESNFLDDITTFFGDFFGGGGGSSQDKASDSGSITTINFSPVTLPSQEVELVQDDSGLLEIKPRESFGIGISGVSEDGEGGDKDGVLNSIVNDPIKLGLSITAIIGIIAGFTGGK